MEIRGMEMHADHVGVRELKAKAAELLRNVRESGAEYVITHHGKPVARIVPIRSPEPVDPASLERLFDDLDRLAEELGRAWPAGVGAVETVREVRRDL